MEEFIKDVEEAVNKKYLEIKGSPDIEIEILKIFRAIRWEEPELAIYVKKRLTRLSKEKGNS